MMPGKPKTHGPHNNERYKSGWCENIQNNRPCPYSTKCQFAHNSEEITKWARWRAVKHTTVEADNTLERGGQDCTSNMAQIVLESYGLGWVLKELN